MSPGAAKKKKKKQNKDIFNHLPLQKPINPLWDVEGRFKATFPQFAHWNFGWFYVAVL